jgi:DNA-binding NarL/FixJ family response regulator
MEKIAAQPLPMTLASPLAAVRPTTLIHIDDDEMLGTLIAHEIECWPEARHLGQATTAAAGLELARSVTPNVVLLDFQLPDRDGAVLIRELRRLPQPAKIIMVTACNDPLTWLRLSRLPIAGLVWKLNYRGGALRSALAAVASGGTWFPKSVASIMTAQRGAPDALHKIFSPRELDLLPEFGAGESDEAIGVAHGLSALTVKRHRATLLGKLGLHSTPGLMQWAARIGLVTYHHGWVQLHPVNLEDLPPESPPPHQKM